MSKYHTIQRGDTFWGLERKYGLKHGTLQKLNPTLNPRTLQIGSKIVISEENDPTNEVKPSETTTPKQQPVLKEDFESNEDNMLPFNISHMAKKVIDTYRKNSVKYSQNKRQFGIDAKYSDCSATVHTIFAASKALHILSSKNTLSMRQEILGKGDTFRKSNPMVGDVMMWGGHVTIVTETSLNHIRFAHMGNSGPRMAYVKLSNGTLENESVWGSGGFIGFWSPK